MLNGKSSAAMPIACTAGSAPLHKCISPCKSYPSLNSDARTQRTPEALPTTSTYPFGTAVDGTAIRAPRADSAVHYPPMYGTRADEAQTLSAELTNNLV